MMNNSTPINWQAFKSRFLQNPDKHLQFEYADSQLVEASFHISEIKQAPIVSVDCGGKMNAWTEIIVQLWEPSTHEAERSMKVSKALAIIDRVEKVLPLNPLATVKIEFGNSRFDTRQLYPGEFIADNDTFTVKLASDFTQCKAQNRSQGCGTAADKTAQSEFERIDSGTASCEPGSVCCS